jgi:hypothetical protein
MKKRTTVTLALLFVMSIQCWTGMAYGLILPQSKASSNEASRQQEQQLASAALDKFLKGIKLADLREGKTMMAETQWITGDADFAENFYSRPVYTDAETLFEGIFDTDIPGVIGYKRLMEMKAVSKAKTPLQIRYLAIAYKDKSTGEWKVLSTRTGESGDIDIDKNVAYFGSHLSDTKIISEQDMYNGYGQWLLLAGRISDAAVALKRAQIARELSDSDRRESGVVKGMVPIRKLQIL